MRWVAVVLVLALLGCVSTPEWYISDDGRDFEQHELDRAVAHCENEALTISSRSEDLAVLLFFYKWEYEMAFENCMRARGFVGVEEELVQEEEPPQEEETAQEVKD